MTVYLNTDRLFPINFLTGATFGEETSSINTAAGMIFMTAARGIVDMPQYAATSAPDAARHDMRRIEVEQIRTQA
jgi:hypothetical protein